MSPRILLLSGSERTGSVNLRLTHIVDERLRAKGASTTLVSLRALNLPIYDGDYEGTEGVPEGARALRAAIDATQGVFIASPEYNAGYTPLLKNALDWASRVSGKPVFAGKVVAVGAASGGARGGYRSLTQFRSMIELGMGAFVIPEMVSVPGGDAGFSADGLADAGANQFLDAMVTRLVAEAAKVG